jgi:hypothetical protein
MSPGELREGLIPAEMALAHFNAVRTTPAETGASIERITTPEFECLLEPARPTSTYYNRAVAKSADSLTADSLRNLRNEVVGLEVFPDQVSAESAGLLLEHGFMPSYQLCYLAAVPAGRLTVEREVIRLASSQADTFLDLLELSGVTFPAGRRALKRKYYCTEDFQAYVAKGADGTVCGWTTLHRSGSAAFFGNSFTLPQYRHLGMHGALLAARLNATADMGLKVAYTDVEYGSQSHYNCERAGFRALTINTIWTRGANIAMTSPDTLSSLASEYTKDMTSIRGRRVQRLLKREFAGADYVLLAQVASGASAVLGLSASGAALCATDGKGKEASVFKWSHGSTEALEMRFDLHKDSLPVVATGFVALARLRAQVRLHVDAGTIALQARSLVAKVLKVLA